MNQIPEDSQLSFAFDEDVFPDWAKRIVVFDTETTGLDLKEARIVTACVVELDIDGNVVGKNEEWLADPVIEIPVQASNVHGVSTEFARENGRDAKQVVSEIIEALSSYLDAGIPVVAYNAPYDFSILHFEALRHGLTPLQNPSPILDPLVLDKWADKYRKGKRKLEVTAEVYGVPLSDAHNATADAIASGRVLQAIVRKFPEKFAISLEDLHQLQISQSKNQEADFADYMRRSVNPDFQPNYGWPLKLN
jgi:DNA polymerase-3 subunit epsilon